MRQSIGQKIILPALRLYRRTLSPDTGWFSYRYPYGVCRFSPTCSAYTLQAVEQYGALRGVWYGVRRVIRCHPWQSGGFDPVTKP